MFRLENEDGRFLKKKMSLRNPQNLQRIIPESRSRDPVIPSEYVMNVVIL
jgi:hypothetical protein